MTSDEKYQIGTPEMLRKQAQMDQKIERIRDHPATAVIICGGICAFGLALAIYGALTGKSEIQTRRALELEAAALLEAKCTEQGGVIYDAHNTKPKSPTVCLAEEAIIFSVPGR